MVNSGRITVILQTLGHARVLDVWRGVALNAGQQAPQVCAPIRPEALPRPAEYGFVIADPLCDVTETWAVRVYLLFPSRTCKK